MRHVDDRGVNAVERPHVEKQALSLLTVDLACKTERVDIRTVLYVTKLELFLCILFFYF